MLPPLVGVAVNVIFEPIHTISAGEAIIFTLAETPGFTEIVILFDVAGEPVAQKRLDVIIHVIASPLVSVEEVKVEFVAPVIFAPFFFH